MLTTVEEEETATLVSAPPAGFSRVAPLLPPLGPPPEPAIEAASVRVEAGSLAEPAPSNRDQLAVLTDGAFFSLMVGTGETYLPAFALALGASQIPSGLEITTGLLAAVPIFLGSVVQLVTPFAVRRLGSHRRWSASAVLCQAVSLVLIPLALLFEQAAVPFLFLAATMYWTCGLSCGPSWNTWMEDVIPAAVRTHFFARRVRLCQFCTMVGFMIGGLLLEAGKQGDWLNPAFLAVFLFAAGSRFVSSALLANTSEPATARQIARSHVGLSEIMRQLTGRNRRKSASTGVAPGASGTPVGSSGMRMLWFLFAMQASVWISGPYFTPFMLRKLHLGYHEFMLLVVLGFLGKVVALRAWGKLANRAGARLLLWIGAISIVPCSGVWVALEWLEHPMWYLSTVQFLGGIGWAAYELGFFLLFFEAIPRRERTSMLTIYNFGNSASILIGALLGAVWLSWQQEAHTAYLALFVLSSLARLCSLVLLRRVPPATVPQPAV